MQSRKPNRTGIYDISVLVHAGMPAYPGDPEVCLNLHLSTARNDAVNLTSICMGAHSGTHVDAPYHIDSEWPALQNLDQGVMLGPATVMELDVSRSITAQCLAGQQWHNVERVLFKTSNSILWEGPFRQDYVYLEKDAAEFIIKHTQVRLVGIDYLSIEQFGADSLPVHAELLGHGIVIVEGLDLSAVAPGEYQLCCLPLKIASSDGAPARVLLVDSWPT